MEEFLTKHFKICYYSQINSFTYDCAKNSYYYLFSDYRSLTYYRLDLESIDVIYN